MKQDSAPKGISSACLKTIMIWKFFSCDDSFGFFALWERRNFLGKSLSPVRSGKLESTSQVTSRLCTPVSVSWGTWSEEEGGWEKVWGQVPQNPREVSALLPPANIISMS